jgi:hypothetical protein
VTDEWSTDPVRKRSDHRVLALVLAGVAAAALVFASFSHQWLYAGETQLQYRPNDHDILPVGELHEIGFGLRSRVLCTAGGDCTTATNAEHVDTAHAIATRARFLLHEPVVDELKELSADGYATAVLERDVLDAPGNPNHDYQVLELTATKHVFKTSGAFAVFGWIALVAVWIAALSLVVAGAMVLARRELAWPIMPSTTALLGIATALVTGCVFAAVKPGPPGYVGVGVGFIAFGIGVVLGLWSSVMLARLLRPADPDLLEDAMNPEQF